MEQYSYEFSTNGITVPEFAWKHLHLNAIEQMLFGFSFSFGFINATLEQLCIRFGIKSTRTMEKCFKDMVKRGIMTKRKITISGTKRRSIYTHCYDRNGKLPNETIEHNLERGLKFLQEYYYKVNPIRYEEMRHNKGNSK